MRAAYLNTTPTWRMRIEVEELEPMRQLTREEECPTAQLASPTRPMIAIPCKANSMLPEDLVASEWPTCDAEAATTTIAV